MSDPVVLKGLVPARRRWLKLGVWSATGWAILAGGAVLCGGIWLDLIWETPAELRMAFDLTALVSALAALVAIGTYLLLRGTPQFFARRLDLANGSGGEILSGLDLSAKSLPAGMSAALAQVAVERADRLAEGTSLESALPAKPLVRPWIGVGIATACLLVMAMLVPRLIWTQLVRFADPFGDHPPYSRLSFEVAPGDGDFIYGHGVDIRATVAGEPVEQLSLVMQSPDGRNEEVLPMFPEADGRWRATVSRLTRPVRYHVRSEDHSRSHFYRLAMTTVPRIEKVRFRITPPSYTHEAAYEGPLPQSGISGLPGTKVEFWATSNRPLQGGELTLVAADGESSPDSFATPTPLTTAPAAPEQVLGSFELHTSGSFAIRVRDVAGQWSEDRFGGAITLLTDGKPLVRIEQPPATSLATPEATLPIVILGEDDYGLSRVQLFRSLNDSRALPLDLPLPGEPARRWQGSVALPLSEYGLEAGDVIKVYARVEDNDPAGAKGFESPISTITIVSQAEFERLVRMREGFETLLSKYREGQARLEKLAAEIAELEKQLAQEPAEAAAGDEHREALKQLAERLQKEAKALETAAKHSLPYDLDRQLEPQLQRLSKQLKEAGQQTDKLARADDAPKLEALRKALESMRQDLAGQQQQLNEEAVAPLEHMEKAYPLLEDQARFVLIAARQLDLAQRLASLKGRDDANDPVTTLRARDFEREQQRIRDELSELLDDIDAHLEQLPERPEFDKLRETASDFVEKARQSGASEAMANAETRLAEMKSTPAHASAQKASDILQSLLSKCEGMQGSGQQCLAFNPALAAGLGDTVAQLLAGAGLLPSTGPGQGSGMGGYSASRNSLSNVGMYGLLPSLGGEPRRGQGGNSRARRHQRPDSTTSTADNASEPLPAAEAAAGGRMLYVPLNYRDRVREYFERVAEETAR